MNDCVLRIHYNDAPLTTIDSRSQPAPGDFSVPRGHGKPVGLWYSVGAAWLRWCRRNDFGNPQPRYAHVLTLDMPRIACIATKTDLIMFTRRFGGPLLPHYDGLFVIDWPRVAQEWAGIEASPYLWEARFEPDFMWYYGWDCESGCVWDARAVLSIRSRERRRGVVAAHG